MSDQTPLEEVEALLYWIPLAEAVVENLLCQVLAEEAEAEDSGMGLWRAENLPRQVQLEGAEAKSRDRARAPASAGVQLPWFEAD